MNPSPVYEIIGASSIRPMVKIVVSADGRYLSGSMQLPDGKVLQRTYDLKPITDVVMAQMRAYHESKNGKLPPQEISGFFSSIFNKASDIAKKIGSSSAVKSLYSAAKKYGPDALSQIPYGDKVVKLARKLHDRIVEARNGSEDAYAKLRAISEMAKQGVPAAQEAMEMAKRIGASLNAKEAMTSLAPKATGLLMAAKSGSEEAISKISSLKDIAANGDPKAQDVMDLMSRLNAYLKSKGGTDQAVSGWAYNKPYRGPLSALADRTPGIGMMARSLYVQGAK